MRAKEHASTLYDPLDAGPKSPQSARTMSSTLAGLDASANRLPAVDGTLALVVVAIRPVVGLILAVLLVIPV